MTGERFSDLNDLQAIIEELEQKIVEQQATINKLKEENERLKCMNNQLEKRLDYSIAYDMEECE